MDECTVNGNPKCQKLCKEKDAGIDKISRLPEAILENILSFLPTVDAVKTSVLCKKWQHLWKSVPNIEFVEDSVSKRELFMNSVERVLLLRGSSHIRWFYIACNVFRDASRVNLWVSAAVQRNVEECFLYLSGIEGQFALPFCLFTCTSLTYLELKITFSDERSTEKLLSCPALQELFVDDCHWSHLRAVTIFTPMLKSLAIRDKDLDSHWVGCQVMICANNLERISCKSAFVNDYCLRQSCSLMEAVIDVAKFPLSRSREAAYRISKLLQGMRSVKRLELSSKTIEVLTSADELYTHLLDFGNLRSLNLGRLDLECGAVRGLLHHSPHLEMLEFRKMIGVTSDDAESSSLLNPTPGCFASHLKQIKIEPEMEKVFREELLKLPCGSKGCQIILS